MEDLDFARDDSTYPSSSELPFTISETRTKPIYRPHAKFSHAEDVQLCNLVREHGLNNWRLIARFMSGRNSRQCRERWLNYLNPGRNIQPWTAAEDSLLEEKYREMGPRWMLMVPFFQNRTDGMIKNRYQVLKRKAQKLASVPKTSDGPGEDHLQIARENDDDDWGRIFDPVLVGEYTWQTMDEGLYRAF
jgi:hypothetical protein